jgi:cytochrome c oxidase subunit 4
MSSHAEPSYRDTHTTDNPADERVHVHVHPVSFYVKIFLALAGLTIFTVASSRLDIDGFVSPGTVRGAGIFNFILAMIVASVKASLVVTFFMHLKDDNRFNALVFVGSVLFAGVFLAYTLNDTNHRNDGDRFHGLHVLPSTGERAPGGVDHQFTFEEPEAGIERTEEFVPHGEGHEGGEGEAHEGGEAHESEAAPEGEAPEGEAPAEAGH